MSREQFAITVSAFLCGCMTGVCLVIAILAGNPEPRTQPFIDKAAKVIESVEPTPAFSIVGPEGAGVGELVELVARGESKGFAWGGCHDNAFLKEGRDFRIYEAGKVLTFSTPRPGIYLFTLGVFNGAKPEFVNHVLKVGGVIPPRPTPEPEPKPTPPVPPPPHVSRAYVLIAYESKSVTPEQSRAYTNLRDGPAAKYLKDKGHLLDIVDQNKHPAAKFAPFKSLPEMIVLPFDGRYEATPVWRGPMPATADGVVEVIKRVTQ